MLLSVFGAFIILVLSTTYILYSTIRLQELSDNSFQRERYIKSLREALIAYQEPLLEYLSTRSSNALSRHLIESQQLRKSLPAGAAIPHDPTELRERELYSLIGAYLDLADAAVDEKRGRNIRGYTAIYDEMTVLLGYIDAQIETIGTERFKDQLDRYGAFIGISRDIQSWNLVFIVAISLFTILLLLHSVEKTTLPMTRLSAMASGISEGDFGMDDIKMSSIYEIDHVVEAFNRMKGEIRSQIEEIRRQEHIKHEYMQEKMRNMKMQALLRRMEIYTLQAQMNPHFLFNTLNTGMQLAIVEGADRTGEYMEHLSLLFRHNVRNADIIVPLRHEIEGLRFYFYLLKVRFPRNLDLSLDCDEALLDDVRVPVSILQPLVENCVVHAFKKREERGSILVRAEKKGRFLAITVADDGVGMEARTIEGLLQPLPIDAASSRVMGLENVIQRLYVFYPDDPGVIRIESEPGKGSAIIITIDTEREPCIEF